MKKIRNFCIIAHIDHGKSTLSDRFLEITGLKNTDNKKALVLDTMELEQERGITIKSQAVRMPYLGYELNLIDTPGHVDFSYEVSRSLKASENAILLVDATQGVEAQTVANAYLAIDYGIKIIPAINKIDMPNANISETKDEIVSLLACPKDEILEVSAKTGAGTKELLKKVIEWGEPPEGTENAPLKALVFDSKYDQYRGVIVYVRVFDGSIKSNDKIFFIGRNKVAVVYEVGYFTPDMHKLNELNAGEVGYIITNLKDISEIRDGDTVTLYENPCASALTGVSDVKSMVYCGLYPVNNDEYTEFNKALERYRLNDAALTFISDHSMALGYGYRCGFLGLLHMEIVQERIEREYGLHLIATAPNVRYKIVMNSGKRLFVTDPAKLPDTSDIAYIQEPYVIAKIITPPEYMGNIFKLLQDSRGVQKNINYLSNKRVVIEYELPLSEIMFQFYDKLKSLTRGYASIDYDFAEYKTNPLVRVQILIGGNAVDSLSFIVPKSRAYHKSIEYTKRLKQLIPRHLFEVVIQAAIGSKVIARETIKQLKKNVIAKCYGGDITRKRKLLEKQKEGKKRMKQVGLVSIPQEAFLAVLKINGGTNGK